MILKVIGIIIAIGFLFHMLCHYIFRSVDIHPKKPRRLEYYMPVYESGERHKMIVQASPEKTYEALHLFDMSASSIVKFFLFLRGTLNMFSKDKSESGKKTEFTLAALTASGGMFLLEEAENQEIVLGMGGKFWEVKADIFSFTSVDDFINFNKEGCIKVAWNLYIEKNDDGTTTLSTETRNLCFGKKAKSAFRIYWWVIRPYSGWIRIEMLKMIKKQAESQVSPSP